MATRKPKGPAEGTWRIRCLKCGLPFDSWDRVCNRICPPCSRDNQKEFTPRTVSGTLYTSDGAVSLGHDD